MNKLTKGAIAGAAGIALLLGGAGSFALWNQSTTINAGTVSSGQLKLTHTTSGTWSDITNTTPAPIADINSFKMVPGQTLKYTQDVTVTAIGTDLSATLGYSLGSGSRDLALASYLSPIKIDATPTDVGAATVTNNNNGTFKVTPVAGGVFTVDVTLTITLPATGEHAITETTAQNLALDLNNIEITLTQNTPVS